MKLLHLLLLGLITLCGYLGYSLWFDEKGGIHAIENLEKQLSSVEMQNTELQERNHSLEVIITSLKNDINSQEELARYKLGLIQEDETFYQLLPDEEEEEQ